MYEYEIFKHFGSDKKRFFPDEIFIVCNIYNHPHSKINSVLNICTSLNDGQKVLKKDKVLETYNFILKWMEEINRWKLNSI